MMFSTFIDKQQIKDICMIIQLFYILNKFV